MKHSTLSFFIFTVMMFISCTQEETCREKTAVYLRAGFYVSETTNLLNLDSITVYGLQRDSLYKNDKNLNKIALPLNNSEQQSIFVMNINGIKDTLEIYYTNSDYFVSYACGMIVTHNMDTLISTNHIIKSLKIVNRDINTTDVQHIQIFL